MKKLLLLLALVLLAGCAMVPSTVPTGTAGYVAPVSDPIEPFNRGVQSFNGSLNRYLIYSFGQAYAFFVPKMIREGLHHFSDNLAYPGRLVNNCLQGKWQGAWVETERFGINTTIGLLGVRDQATDWGFTTREEGFPETLGTWGIGNGPFLNVPFLGPMTTRRAAGQLLGLPFNLASYVFPSDTGAVIRWTNLGAKALDNSSFVRIFFETNYDTYALTRAYSVLCDEAEVADAVLSGESDPDQCLGALLFEPKDERFQHKAYTHFIRLKGADRSIPYSCWPKADARRLMVILPGLGGHRLGSTTAALAELYHQQGWNVIAFSSTMHPEVFLGFPDHRYPGNFEQDSADLDKAIGLAMADFTRRHGISFASCSVLGYSLGAINSLYLAEKGNATQYDRFIAINPPRCPLDALRMIDSCFRIPEKWGTPEEAEAKARRLLQGMVGMLTAPGADLGKLPLSREESMFLVGFYMHFPLADVLAASIDENGKHVEGIANGRDIGGTLGYPWLTYVEKQVLPEYVQKTGKQMTLADLEQHFRLDSLENTLKTDARLRLLHSENDFLCTQEDMAWFREVFGIRAVILPEGSHCGSLANPKVQAALLQLAN